MMREEEWSSGMARKEPGIPVGTRFKLSKLGEARNPRLKSGAEGTIVGRSQYKSSLRVIIDGRKTPLSMHRDYIEPISRGDGYGT
jgi:hypothetical protein